MAALPYEKTIEGDRICLKKLGSGNATRDYCSWLNDPEVTLHLVTKKATIESVKDYIKKKNADPNCAFFGIFHKESGRHIGNIKLEPIDFGKKTGILGIMIGDKDYWGAGIGVEAITLLTEWAFDYLGLESIEAGVLSGNKRSKRAFEKAGFRVDRVEEKSMENKGKMEDKIIMKASNG